MFTGCDSRSASLIVMLTVILSLATPALAQDCPELVGRWPYGAAIAVAVSGNHVYFGDGTALMVADVSDPAAPAVVVAAL